MSTKNFEEGVDEFLKEAGITDPELKEYITKKAKFDLEEVLDVLEESSPRGLAGGAGGGLLGGLFGGGKGALLGALLGALALGSSPHWAGALAPEPTLGEKLKGGLPWALGGGAAGALGAGIPLLRKALLLSTRLTGVETEYQGALRRLRGIGRRGPIPGWLD